jgi:amino acid adenylation domain-containing protein
MRTDASGQAAEPWNQTTRTYPRDACIHELFEEQATRQPDAVAAVCSAKRLRYGELEAHANQLAHLLRALGVGPEIRVGVCMERSADLVVAILGVLKAGGAYLPLDPTHPPERLRFMLREAGASVVITKRESRTLLPDETEVHAVDLDEDRHRLLALPTTRTKSGVCATNLACVFFTSGSQGEAKPIDSPHRATVRTFFATDFIEYGPALVVLQLAPMSWDGLTLELWTPLLHGGRSVLAPPGLPSPEYLGEIVRRENVNTIWLTASLLNLVVDDAPDALSGITQLMTGGEAASADHIRRLRQRYPEMRIVNGYGPAESTVFATTYRVPSIVDQRSTVPIGSPIANTRVYVLDEGLRAVTVGARGEIYVAGDGLARGYMSRAAQTSERFLPDPFGAPGDRMYRTGDVGTWLPGGTLEFVGRTDSQVKIRGHRVEPGEVEAALAEHPSVTAAVVVPHDEDAGRRLLVAYVVTRSPDEDVGSLRRHLEERLPAYLVPSRFVRMPRLPLNANGKVDRGRLREPEIARSDETNGYVAPRTAQERFLADLWREVLEVDRVGVHDNFFELGGHSLLATRFLTRARQRAGLDLPLRALFACGTVAELASYCRERWPVEYQAIAAGRAGRDRGPDA